MSLHAFRILSLAGCAMTILALAPMAHAQIANPDPAAVKPGAYTVEPGHTRVLFSVSHFGFSTWYGDFSDATGALVLDPSHAVRVASRHQGAGGFHFHHQHRA